MKLKTSWPMAKNKFTDNQAEITLSSDIADSIAAESLYQHYCITHDEIMKLPQNMAESQTRNSLKKRLKALRRVLKYYGVDVT